MNSYAGDDCGRRTAGRAAKICAEDKDRLYHLQVSNFGYTLSLIEALCR